MMCHFNCGKKLSSFALTFAIGLSAASFLQNNPNGSKSEDKNFQLNQGNGTGASFRRESAPQLESSKSTDANLKIISKPRANYTDLARQHNTQGIVALRVIFLADGKIGNISVASGLPNGLTEQAVEAAKLIEFEPKKENGKPQSVTKLIQYTFTIY